MLRRGFALIVLAAFAVALAIAAWPQAFGLQRQAIVAKVVPFRGVEVVAGVALVLVLLAFGLLARRSRRFFGAAAVLSIAFAAGVAGLMLVRGIGSPGLPAAGTNDITILSWNTRGDGVAAAPIAALAQQDHADVVALPATTRERATEVADALAAHGIRMTVLSIDQSDEARARSTSLLVRVSTLGRYKLVTRWGDTEETPTVVAEPADGQNGPRLLAVHTLAPRPGDESTWRRDLDWVAARCDAGNVVMAGDFNSTLDHLAGLPASDGGTVGTCRDSALASGDAAVGTWPTSVPALLGAPIDHVMATPNWRTTGFRVVQSEDAAGSDHRPIIARLTPSGE